MSKTSNSPFSLNDLPTVNPITGEKIDYKSNDAPADYSLLIAGGLAGATYLFTKNVLFSVILGGATYFIVPTIMEKISTNKSGV